MRVVPDRVNKIHIYNYSVDKDIYINILVSGASPGFWFAGTSDKISSKVARISVQGSDIQQKLTQLRFLKNL